LRRRQALQAIEHWRAQLLKPGVRKLHLGLHAGGPRHLEPGGLSDHVLQQGRLTDPGLTAYDEYPALTTADRLQQPVQYFTLAAPPP
jgi:hypothetical protein